MGDAAGVPVPAVHRPTRWIVVLGLLSGLIALGCAATLIGGHAVRLRRASGERDRIARLEQEVESDAGAASRLEQERERLTAASLRTEARNRILAWMLLLSAGTCIACGRRSMNLRPQPSPSLDRLKAARFAPPPGVSGTKPGNRAGPVDSSAGISRTGPVVETGIDLSFVDDLVARIGPGREGAIAILQAIQTHYRYLPDEALERVCRLTEITPAQIAGTSTFYAQFRRAPVGRHVVRICHGTACHVAGIGQIDRELRRHLGIGPDDDTDERRMFTLDKVACLGCCSLAPVMMIAEETAGHLTPSSARQALDRMAVTT